MSIIHPWYQLGYIIPHLTTDMDAYQFYHIAPDGMMLVTPCLDLQGHSLEAIERELPTFWKHIDLLAKKKMDRISLSGVPVGSYLGRERTLDLLKQASDRAGMVVDTDIEAHVAAMKHIGATRIAMATRWQDSTVSRLTKYMNESGFEVLTAKSHPMNFKESKERLPEDDHNLALELGRQALREAPQAQALLMPGGLWHAIHAVPILEAEFGVPVLTNIGSTTWAALHAAGKDRVKVRPDPRWGMMLQKI
jgi:maleate cis-trans isomerase